MIGGGRGAFIGAVHRLAAIMDGQAELVAGAFSSDAARSKASGADLWLDPARVYGSYREMARAEAARAGAVRATASAKKSSAVPFTLPVYWVHTQAW